MLRLVRYIPLLLLAAPTAAQTHEVGGGSPLHSIRAAIAAAAPGDTVLVHPGTYREGTLYIDKALTLRGIAFPVIDGEEQDEIIVVRAPGVVVEGLQVENGGRSGFNDIAAIRIANTRDVTVRNNRVYRTFFGIYSQYSVNCVISGNEIVSDAATELNSANGIHCWKSDSLLIEDNIIRGHRDGIYFEFVTRSLIRGNVSEKNVRYGLHFMFSNDDVYRDNIFRDNGAGVAVMFTRGVTMINNLFTENWGRAAYGLLLKEISDSRVEDNRFHRNTSGIFMEGTTRVQVTGNDFRNNGWAMQIQASCADNTVGRNNFRGNSFDVATNGSLVLNRFVRNYWDKYEGYDLNRDGVGDVPFRPISMYAMLVERHPPALMLFRSVMANLLDRAEKVFPSLTPENLIDLEPVMKPYRHDHRQ